MGNAKKTVLAALVCAALAACGGEKGESAKAAPAATKSAVVFYSQNGATRSLAKIFAEATGADLVEIKLAKPYPSTYDSTIAAVREERETGRWPELENAKPDLAKYDTLYLGYPIMFGAVPPPMRAFLDSNDLSGKTVVPFCTYGSGGRKASAEEIKTLEPKADVTIAMGISNRRITAENGTETARGEVSLFLENLRAGKTEEVLCGGYSEQRPLTAEDSAVFAKATEPYAYLGLRPLSVSTQVVAGTNYLFTCEMKAFGGPAKEVNVKIFRPLPGRGEPELVVVE